MSNISMDFQDKVVLITGASRGIGRATAKAFAERGANVIINYKSDHESAKVTLEALKPGNHTMISADVSKPEELEQLYDKVLWQYKRLDILVKDRKSVV